MSSNVLEFLTILVAGLLVSAGSYVMFSDQAAVFFGFLYVMAIPVVHELFVFGTGA